MNNIDDIQDEFISEPIAPVKGTFDTAGMARGEPGLPSRFIWRDKEYAVAEVLEKWKESGPCKGGSSEMYLRKHWFRIRCTDSSEMTIYFERQPKSKQQSKTRCGKLVYSVGVVYNPALV